MIPRIAHFIWIGRSFPWTNVLAIKSAVLRGGFDDVVLHHTDDLSDSRWWNELNSIPKFDARRFEPVDYIAGLDKGNKLADLYRRLVKPAARSDVLRAAVLAREGGVYLDLDTVTVRTLAPLCLEAEFFCGSEHIAWPAFVKHSRNPFLHVNSLGLEAIRHCFTMAPNGWRGFRRVEHLYYVAVNGAILAARRQHPLLLEMLDRMTRVSAERENTWAALGPHLLQTLIEDHNYENVKVHPTQVFYPLPPEISRHWFRQSKKVSVEDVLSEDTRVVHWYSSVSTRSLVELMSPEYVQRNAERRLICALARPFVDADFEDFTRKPMPQHQLYTS